jgi:hypothetical protein
MSTKALFSSIILSVCSTLAFADTGESSMSIVAGGNAGVFKVVYKSASATRVEVTIINSKNEVVFTESFTKMNEFARPYNFNGLPEGEYTIEVKDDYGKKIEKVKYSLGTVKSIFKVTKMNNETAKYILSVANKGENVINVSILNADGETLLDNAHVVDGDFGIVYNLVEAGAYTFVISDQSGNARTIQF